MFQLFLSIFEKDLNAGQNNQVEGKCPKKKKKKVKIPLTKGRIPGNKTIQETAPADMDKLQQGFDHGQV